ARTRPARRTGRAVPAVACRPAVTAARTASTREWRAGAGSTEEALVGDDPVPLATLDPHGDLATVRSLRSEVDRAHEAAGVVARDPGELGDDGLTRDGTRERLERVEERLGRHPAVHGEDVERGVGRDLGHPVEEQRLLGVLAAV